MAPMDPLAAIGLVGNIIGFIELAAEIVKNGKQIYDSASGTSEGNLRYEFINREMEAFVQRLLLPMDEQSLSGSEKSIYDLARQCSDLAQRVSCLLDKVKAKDRHSMIQSVFAAVKVRQIEHKRRTLQAQLENCRGQLALQLNHFNSLNMRSSLESLVKTSHENSSRIVRLQSQLEELQEMIQLSYMSAQGKEKLRNLVQISGDFYNRCVEQRFLDSLVFQEMHERPSAITDAFVETFEWLFEGNHKRPSQSDEYPRQRGEGEEPENMLRLQARESFNSWLSSGHGIFHISGKLGSGKSTLIKFLTQHNCTKKKLKEWAGDHQLIIASFYFWNPGSKLQKSMEGLLRSFLYQCLKEIPELIPHVFPRKWEELQVLPSMKLDLQLEEICTAFENFVNMPTAFDRYSFCFFIDGLDEYEETPDKDYRSIVDWLCRWSVLRSANVKICVSSREQNVFMNHFPSDQRLRMQDLTQEDMRQYIHGKLQHIDGSYNKEILVGSIIARADGIFLWVALVVRRLRDLIEDEVSFDRLQREIKESPQELDNLFNHIFASIEPSNRRIAYRIFAILTKIEEWELELPLLCYDFMDECDGEITDADIPRLSSREYRTSQPKFYNKLRKRLMACCRGLVEPVKSPLWYPNGTVITFTHRSVPEFLAEKRADDIQRYLSMFSIENTISHLLLAYILITNPSDITSEYAARLTYLLMYMRHNVGISTVPFLFEEQLDSALDRLGFKNIPRTAENYLLGMSIGRYDRGSYRYLTLLPCDSVPRKPVYKICDPVYMTAIIGNSAYVQWKISKCTSVTDNPLQTLICLISILNTWSVAHISTEQFACCIRMILEKGLSPQSPTYVTPSGLPKTPTLTMWQNLILWLFPRNIYRRAPTYNLLLWKACQIFLEHGADPYLVLSFPIPDEDGYSCHCTLMTGREQDRISIKHKLYLGYHHPVPSNTRDGERIVLNLPDIFKFLQANNLERLLELVERNIRLCEENPGMQCSSIHERRLEKAILEDVNNPITETATPIAGPSNQEITAGTKPNILLSRRDFLAIYILGLLLATYISYLMISCTYGP